MTFPQIETIISIVGALLLLGAVGGIAWIGATELRVPMVDLSNGPDSQRRVSLADEFAEPLERFRLGRQVAHRR